jgi:16S rRNA (cytosine967-C5)-methyltransferase
MRRLPELKWRRREDDFLQMQKLQLELLSAAAQLLKPGGTLLYSVCTNELEETTAVVKSFSSLHPQLTLQSKPERLPEALSGAFTADGTATIMPHRHGVDGFFIALWS